MIIKNILKSINQDKKMNCETIDMDKEIIEIKAIHLCNYEVTNLVHAIRKIHSKSKKVKLILNCHYCKNFYETTKFNLKTVDAKILGISCLNDGDGVITSICPICEVENKYGSYRGGM